jgi:hypothetical protein
VPGCADIARWAPVVHAGEVARDVDRCGELEFEVLGADALAVLGLEVDEGVAGWRVPAELGFT